jgi:hypothetical protein
MTMLAQAPPAEGENPGGGMEGENPFAAQPAAAVPKAASTIPAVTNILVRLEARNLLSAGSSANTEFANMVQNMLRTNDVFVAEGTMLTNRVQQVISTNVSYMFDMVLRLKTPLIQQDLTTQPGKNPGAGPAQGGKKAGPTF